MVKSMLYLGIVIGGIFWTLLFFAAVGSSLIMGSSGMWVIFFMYTVLFAGWCILFVAVENHQLRCPKCQKDNSIRWKITNFSSTSNTYQDGWNYGRPYTVTTTTGILLDKCRNCGYEFNPSQCSTDDNHDSTPLGSEVWEQRYKIGTDKFRLYEYKEPL